MCVCVCVYIFFFYLDFLSRDTHDSQHNMGRRRPFVTPHYRFHPLYEHLHIWVITAEGSPLHIDNSQTRTGTFDFRMKVAKH